MMRLTAVAGASLATALCGLVLGGCPAVADDPVSVPDGNTVSSGSFEDGSSFGNGVNRRVRILDGLAAPNGTHVAKVTARRVGGFSLDDWPGPVASTVATAKYRATAYVAAPTRWIGTWLQLTVREHTAGGTTVREWSRSTTLTSTFQRLHVAATPSRSGDQLDVYLSSRAHHRGQAFLVDAISLTQGLSVPSGWTRHQKTFEDTFGNRPDYNLLNHWNFGLQDNPSGGTPWSKTGSDPYPGSGTHGYLASGCNPAAPADEYSLPRQVTQTSTGARDDAFSPTGTGLTITATPQQGDFAGCPYDWVSGALNTYGKHEFGGHGKVVFIQFRAEMPFVTLPDGTRSANGAWGSLWTLPGRTNPEGNQVEVDLMEGGYFHGEENPLDVIASNLHTSSQTLLDTGEDLSAGYHTYGVRLNSRNGGVTWFLDGQQYRHDTGGPRGPMFLLMNLHVAASTPAVAVWHTQALQQSPMNMRVSEVQVYERR